MTRTALNTAWDVLRVLLEKENTKSFVSGQMVGDKLGISRAAVGKSVRVLRDMGFQILSVPSRGHRLSEMPDLLLPPLVENKLRTDHFGRDYHYYTEAASTNVVAKSLAPTLETGSVVLAEIQKQGKGRLERIWESPEGGIYMSLFLRPDIATQEVSRITLVIGEAIAAYLEDISGIPAMIKWPNDIMMKDRKICGILTWMDGDMDRVNWVIVGIGINVNIERDYFIEKELNTAGSLKMLTGADFSRVDILTGLLGALETGYQSFLLDGFGKIVPRIRLRNYLLEKEVAVTGPRQRSKGICRGIDDDGCMILEVEGGGSYLVTSGDVTLRNSRKI
ncbi:MAG: biotin--[acetyl-CoA-carboxylase] ligase [Candidatus Thermoplasmatota archaeon]|nr:biotin--[acetyl-CoA-carboxylase] ligase [Candidatus Thermoplasmatota archaeon]MDP7266057.1 biotin--[acetyl-CoA-carboxylase] ligase [Candidatus Thermoplasmatota archaeon]